jgi:hypothetical protein
MGLKYFSGVCVVVNMMIGAGFLALPKVFESGGKLALMHSINSNVDLFKEWLPLPSLLEQSRIC